MPGHIVVQDGQRGAQTSLFVRGGDSDDNKILLDGVDAGDLGGQFDFGPLSTTGSRKRRGVSRPGFESVSAPVRMTSVVSLTTPHGTTSFPSLLFQGDAGNFTTSREELELAGAHKQVRLPRRVQLAPDRQFSAQRRIPRGHVGGQSWLAAQRQHADPRHRSTTAWTQPAFPTPGTFYHVADDATEKDQNIFLSASIDNQTTASFHNSVRYGLTRKREQDNLWNESGNAVSVRALLLRARAHWATSSPSPAPMATPPPARPCSIAQPTTLNWFHNRDQLVYRGDITITPHLAALIGFQYEDERGAEPGSTYYTPVERTNYDYLAAVHGDFKNRFYYTLGGSLEHYSLFGVQTLPRAGVSYYALKPAQRSLQRNAHPVQLSAMRCANPTLPDQDESLYSFLVNNGAQSTIQRLHIDPLAAPAVRTYEGGVEQAFLSQHILFRASYFHNRVRTRD